MDYKESAAIFATLIGEIDLQKLNATTNLSPLKLEPIKNDDKKVGELNDLEKAVFVLLARKVEEWHKKHPSTAKEHWQAHFCGRKMDEIEKQAHFLHQLGWQLIENRLNIHDRTLNIRTEGEIIDLGYGRRSNLMMY